MCIIKAPDDQASEYSQGSLANRHHARCGRMGGWGGGGGGGGEGAASSPIINCTSDSVMHPD